MRRSPEDGGETFENKMGLIVDNRWVVSFNKQILLMWEGHANLKLVVSVIGVKYVFKYEFKVMISLYHHLELNLLSNSGARPCPHEALGQQQ